MKPSSLFHRARRWTLAVTALLFLPAVGSAQVLDQAWNGREQAASFFKAGLEKERRPADWAAAAREFERSLEVSPEPSWEASIQDGSGRWRRHYLPYYYLGRSQWHLGDCENAVDSLTISLEKGEICKSKQGEVRDLERLLAKCEQRGTALAQPARDLVRSGCAGDSNGQRAGGAHRRGGRAEQWLVASLIAYGPAAVISP